MAIGNKVAGRKPKGANISASVSRVGAPFKGVDDRVPFAIGSEEVCVYSYNLVPSNGGVATRKGSREWQIDLDDGSGISVNTIIPYEGPAVDGSEDRLFAVTNEGIWDVTTDGGTPSLELTFSDQTEDAGYGVYVSYINDGGDKYLFYADTQNGLFTYDAGAGTWGQTTGITGPDETNIAFVMVHKARIWLLEKGASKGWYLDPGAITGTATEFFFGSKMKAGGAMRGMFSWSVDGGDGVDDYFVAVSSGGDVMVYQGDDPSSAATWKIRGVYYIGGLPKGYKFGTEQGGELYLLSTYGVVSMSDLLKGIAVASSQAENETSRIAGLLRERFLQQRDLNGWSIRSIPSEGGILIGAPVVPATRSVQYYYNLTVNGWGFWRDLPINCFATWRNKLVFGDTNLRVMFLDQQRDEVLLTPVDPDILNGQPIQFATLTSFSSLGAPGLFKRVKFIRPDIISVDEPTFATAARYDYSLLEPSIPLDGTTAQNAGLWDLDDWDQAVWGADEVKGWATTYGSFGIGRSVAVAYRGEAFYKFTLVGWDVIYDAGGPML